MSSATSAISFSAVASSFWALALPISFDAALRRACASSSVRICARRASSRAITSSTVARASAADAPRLASASARTCGLSRIHLMSSMGDGLHSGRRGRRPLSCGERASGLQRRRPPAAETPRPEGCWCMVPRQAQRPHPSRLTRCAYKARSALPTEERTVPCCRGGVYPPGLTDGRAMPRPSRLRRRLVRPLRGRGGARPTSPTE